jgi:hypothetical protein
MIRESSNVLQKDEVKAPVGPNLGATVVEAGPADF